MEKFQGSWELEQVDPLDFETYLKAVGFGMIEGKAATNMRKVTDKYTIEGDTWTFKAESALMNFEFKFKLNEPTKILRPDGRNVESTFTLEGDDTLVETSKWDDKSAKISRKLENPNRMVITSSYDGGSYRAVLKKVAQ